VLTKDKVTQCVYIDENVHVITYEYDVSDEVPSAEEQSHAALWP